MAEKITLEELVELRNTLNDIIASEEIQNEHTTQHMEEIRDVAVDYTAKRDNKAIMKDISSRIKSSEVITTRNLERIDVGTAFYGRFLKDDEGKVGDLERYILVSSNTYTENPEFISKQSPLGKAVKGKKDDELVSYDVIDESGKKRTIFFFIDSIDREKRNYINNAEVGRAK